ncbi:unnamed protein product [Notodromas monacha]|uniref:Vacuolar protein sorting-associated protein 52 homolog n=1 Tax=Notodromas monacha TaxID=399045 RepID=A0A7R9BT33_9CRUS|nr:unnamed protein product [Notodromas monacha]CAG0919805.1 unnamed protein product [Notodromas monacha]
MMDSAASVEGTIEALHEAVHRGLDLRKYSEMVGKELKQVESDVIQDYLGQHENVLKLHSNLTDCDNILANMEKMMEAFQEDLRNISSEILDLQKRSLQMNHKLRNQQAVRGLLSQFIDELVVPDTIIALVHILETPVVEPEFAENLQQLDQKIVFVQEHSFQESRAVMDVVEILTKLKMKAVTKIREFMLSKIYQLRKPMTNYQVPQNSLLKHKYLFQFLMAHEKEIAREIRDEYVETLSKVYYSYFKAYASRIMKLLTDETASREDMLGTTESIRSSGGLFSGSRPQMRNKSTMFSVGKRGDVLTTDLEAPVIVPHAAQKQESKYPFEALFRSELYALVDNGCREYIFLTEFFSVQEAMALDLFTVVLSKTLGIFAKQLEQWTADCWDTIALFLCVHLIHRYRLVCHKRAVPALDAYWDTLLKLLWPRLEYVLQLNIQSIKDCDVGKLGEFDLHPHYIPRRYAEFSSGMNFINESFPTDSSQMDGLLLALQHEMDSLLLRMAAHFHSRKKQLVFLINNYDMMLGVAAEKTREDSKDCEVFKQQLNSMIAEYIEQVLSPHFGGLIQFIKDGERLIEKGEERLLDQEEKKALQLIRTFNAGWKKALDDIEMEVRTTFPNFKNGHNILQGILAHFVRYYHRLQRVIAVPAFKHIQSRGELLNVHHVVMEVKKFKPNF